MIRAAEAGDLESLAELEHRCFDSDRLSTRSFRRMLARGRNDLLVGEADGRIAGYVLVLHRTNTSLARLYSLAVDPAARGQQWGRRLVRAAEEQAIKRGASRLRLEVRQDNAPAIRLYEALGYREFGRISDYYQDHTAAVRMEKPLAPNLARGLGRVPWHAQSLDFTCGPACLIMAMKAQRPGMETDQQLELTLWRETTTIFMTSGHGGCSPLGLALAAHRRGFAVELSVSDPVELFTDSVRSERKKAVVRLVERGFRRELNAAGIRISRRRRTAKRLREDLARGGMPLLLVSSYLLHGDRTPHWVLLTAMDEHFMYLNDPWVDGEHRSETDCIGVPVTPADLDRMARWGRRKHHACVVVLPGAPGADS